MEEESNKTKLKVNMCTYRRIKIEHEINENLLKRIHLSNLHIWKYREQAFHRKINDLRKNLQHIEPSVPDDIHDQQTLITPNCFTRIHNHFRLLNFSPKSQNRLLCQAPIYDKSNKEISTQLPIIEQQKRHSNAINHYESRISFYRSRVPIHYSCRSAINQHFSDANTVQKKNIQSYLNHQMIDEQRKQMKNDERKTFLLEELEELKHTIEDPNSTLSVLSALTRTILFLDSGIK